MRPRYSILLGCRAASRFVESEADRRYRVFQALLLFLFMLLLLLGLLLFLLLLFLFLVVALLPALVLMLYSFPWLADGLRKKARIKRGKKKIVDQNENRLTPGIPLAPVRRNVLG